MVMKSSGAQTQTVPATSSSRGTSVWKQRGETQGGKKTAALASQLSDERLAHLLVTRGVDSLEAANRFLSPRYEHLRLYGNPTQAEQRAPKGLGRAVGRMLRAIKAKEKIVVFGDYDVDGVTGSALLVDALKRVGADVAALLPHRERDGYGLQLGSIPMILQLKPSLVVTVDNGIQSHAAVAELQQQKIDVVILDHHEPGPTLPAAYVVVNAKQKTETAEFRTLCAGGLVFRVVEELYRRSGIEDGQEKWSLDLAALATVCDMVPLVGDNRLLVSFGLKTLARTRRLGLKHLIDASLGRETLSAETIGFRLGPRLNAAGRLEHAQRALELMLTDAPLQAVELTGLLDKLNRERQAHTRTVVEAATLEARRFAKDPAIVVAHADWPKGVVGLAAGKLAEKFNRPVFVLQEGEQCVGSGRSVPGVDLAAAIESMRPLFAKAGGHAAAAGCTITRENLPAFREGLIKFTLDKRGAAIPARIVEYDTELMLNEVALDFLDIQSQLEPYGMGNPRPVVRLADCTIDVVRRVGADQRHVSLVLRQGQVTRRAIAFGMAERLAHLGPGAKIDALAQVRQNDWGGSRSAELQILDTMVQ